MSSFEKEIYFLTQPFNNQLPRPWMTEMKNPIEAKVLIVGRNQAKGYPISKITHKRHLDALFNRNGESCKSVYAEITDNKPSPTRHNINALSGMLRKVGISEILETNVICYSTPMSSDLKTSQHEGGTKVGTVIFKTILKYVNPKVIIAHGKGTARDLSKILSSQIKSPPISQNELSLTSIANDIQIITIPSLAPPAYNWWQTWAPEYLEMIADRVDNIINLKN